MALEASEHEARPRDDLLRADEVADMMRTTTSHVTRLAEIGEIGSVRVGRFVRFTRHDIAAYLATHHVEPTRLARPEVQQQLPGLDWPAC